jgi:uncharacterized membrane protein
MVSWCCISLGLLLLAVSFFTVGLAGFAVLCLSLLSLGFGVGLLCSRRVQFKIVAREKGSR